MRSWQRSTPASTARPAVSVTRSRRTSEGTAAYGSACAHRHAKARSATGVLPYDPLAPLSQAGEERVDPLPRLRAAAEALPVQPYEAGEGIADIDRHQVGTGLAVHQERLDVRFGVGDGGIGGQYPRPGVERQLRLDRPARAGIAGDGTVLAGVVEEERGAYGDGQLVPVGVREGEAGDVAVALGYGLVVVF